MPALTPIITMADLQEYKFIADSFKNTTSFPMFAIEAMAFDVRHQIGDELLNELMTEYPTFSATNALLMNGGTYSNNGHTYLYQGLKMGLIYYTFARFVNRTAVNFTAAGIVMKDSDLSTPASDKMIQRIETEARLSASTIMCEVVTFLNRNSANYPLWGDHACGGRCNNSIGRFTVMGE